MGYTYVRTVTIDHTKVPNTDQSNFPVLFSGTYSYLKTIANGGNVINANGYDIIFTSDAAGNTKLDHEIESYNAATGAVNFWVRVPTVSHTTDTVIYLWYGNAAITTSQENVTGVWDANFKGVWHLPNGTTLTANDSTNNANNGTISGATATTGEIDGAAGFDGSTGEINVANATSINYTYNQDFTISLWLNIPSGNQPDTTSQDNDVIEKWDAVDAAYPYVMRYQNQTAPSPWKIEFKRYDGTHAPSIMSTATYNDASWHYVVFRKNGSTLGNYKDGTLDATTTDTTTVATTNTSKLYFGRRGDPARKNYLKGTLDEIRISNVARSADWITTEYNNQNSPSTFYAVGAEAVVGRRPSLFLQAVPRAAVR